jgi:large repetitive protein
VTTRLPADTKVVVLGLDPAADDTDLTGLTLGLSGAARAAGADGQPAAPSVVVSDARAFLLYAVTPDANATAVEVTVASDARWRLAAVLGGPADVATTAQRLAASGAAALAAPLVRDPTGSARVMWRTPTTEVS